MLGLPRSVRIFLCREAADMRRGFDRLACMTKELIGQDPLSGHLFVFRSRRGDRLKILYWDGDGYALWYKRLEQGTFGLPPAIEGRAEIDQATLAMILDGIEVARITWRKRFSIAPRLRA